MGYNERYGGDVDDHEDDDNENDGDEDDEAAMVTMMIVRESQIIKNPPNILGVWDFFGNCMFD